MRDGDTIVALSSGALPSGIAVIRISGPESRRLLESLVGFLPEPRRLALATVRAAGEAIDRGFAAWFPAPNSFTGEDCAELQVHGSRAVVRRLLRVIAGHERVRLAEAGEFTRRAFENGKLDLTEVEGLGDLLVAETESQRRQAVARLHGELSGRVAAWREALLDLRAEIEARLDFSDEGDVAEQLPVSVASGMVSLTRELEAALATLTYGRIVREGLRVAIAGPPNAGKSSLLNALARTDVAIVSDEPGTTRDLRETALDVGGQLIVLLDMAGLRATESKAEAEGIRRAKEAIGEADLVLWLVAPDVPASQPPAEASGKIWHIGTKADLALHPPVDFAVSARSGAGIVELLQRLGRFASDAAGGEPALISRERDREAIELALGALADAGRTDELELVAEALRFAAHSLGQLIGQVDAEMVLDRLFLAFCIGK